MSLAAPNAQLLGALLPPGPRPLACAQDFTRGSQLNLYVYELPRAYNAQAIEYFERRARLLLGAKCAYLREDTCQNAKFSGFANLRDLCADVPLLAKLLQVAHIVNEPERADIFLVPFLMGLSRVFGWGNKLSRPPWNRAAHAAFYGNFSHFSSQHLPHFATWPHRHLFLSTIDSKFQASPSPFCPAHVTPEEHSSHVYIYTH
tara:strand:+ start:279 stop:887 length:609 start_codon:yes stop_codon:yes gene_type:complete